MKKYFLLLISAVVDFETNFFLKKRVKLPLQTIFHSKVKETFQFSQLELFPSSKIMTTLRNKRKLAAVSGERQQSAVKQPVAEHVRSGMTEGYISQVSEEIEGRVTEKLSQEFSRTESRILGALSKLHEFLLNPQVRTCSGTVPVTSRNNDFENWEPTEDRSQNDA